MFRNDKCSESEKLRLGSGLVFSDCETKYKESESTLIYFRAVWTWRSGQIFTGYSTLRLLENHVQIASPASESHCCLIIRSQ